VSFGSFGAADAVGRDALGIEKNELGGKRNEGGGDLQGGDEHCVLA